MHVSFSSTSTGKGNQHLLNAQALSKHYPQSFQLPGKGGAVPILQMANGSLGGWSGQPVTDKRPATAKWDLDSQLTTIKLILRVL